MSTRLQYQLRISPKRVTLLLFIIVVFLTLASLGGQYVKYFLVDHPLYYPMGVIRLFNVGREGNVPTWYSSSTLLLCCCLLALITLAKKKERGPYVLHWGVLSIIFLGLSIDESIQIHETVIEPLRSALNLGGFLYNAWVLPGAVFVLIVVVAYARFLIALPKRTRHLFIAAGSVYVFGVLGMDAVGARYKEIHGSNNMSFALMQTAEEFLEMVGIVIFVYALLSYTSRQIRELRVCIGHVPLSVEKDEAERHLPQLFNNDRDIPR